MHFELLHWTPPPVFTSRKKRRSPCGTRDLTQPPKPSTPASKLCRIRRTPARKQKYAFLCTCRCSIRSEKIQIERNTWDSAASSVVGNLLFFRKNQHDIVENVRGEKRRMFSRDSECCAASCERLSRTAEMNAERLRSVARQLRDPPTDKRPKPDQQPLFSF